MNILILTNNNLIDKLETFDKIVSLNENTCKEDEILCFLPTRDIVSKSQENICFINYSPNSWQYKQNARKIGYSLGDNRFQIIDITFAFKIHRAMSLQHFEEVNLLLLTIELFLSQGHDVTISEKIDMMPQENLYLDNLIKNGKVKLYEKEVN